MTTDNPATQLMAHNYFPSPVYIVEKPEFLKDVRDVSLQHLALAKKQKPKLDPLFPVYQTGPIAHEPKLKDFTAYIAQTAWRILNDQGHAMEDNITFFQEMWCQEHQQFGGHAEHIHSLGSQITGFYFIDAPKGGSMVAMHDPRPGKLQVNLPEKNKEVVTTASGAIYFIPKPGQMFFINSWLPHSITRNPTKSSVRLVHFNLGVGPVPDHLKDKPVENKEVPAATVI